ncbi:MAG: GGDEF domain-containing response regulator [Deltaproteobacteria bacterium]|nr:GGDEF domain-containing response regulator [Deltaproteobacteria bacterium]
MIKQRLRILLIEENALDARIAEDFLQEEAPGSYVIQRAASMSDAIVALAERPFDAALLDLTLPDSDGERTVGRIRNVDSNLPIVVLSHHDSERLTTQSLRAGAQEYLIKEHIDGRLLRRAIQYALERKRIERRIEYILSYDDLTKIWNRRTFYERAKTAIAQAKRYHRVAALLLMDLDQFKAANDLLGQAGGDELLRMVARRLTGTVRETDTLARAGGDEFAIFLTEVKKADDVSLFVRRVAASFQKPFVFEGREIFVTASFGSSLHPEDGDNVDALLKNAELAMASAKRAGRNIHHFHSPILNAKEEKRSKMLVALRRALQNSQFRLCYQPLIDIKTSKIIGSEALLRWDHPVWGLVPPDEFVPLAEDLGLIVPIGQWVLVEACRQAQRWEDALGRHLGISVNISALQLNHQDLPEIISKVLEETKLDPKMLELELTESSFVQDEDAALDMIARIRKMGISIAIDDFGTGYSSLRYLNKLPVDKLKIDRSFISDLGTDPDRGTMVEAIIAMARSLRLGVIAEGVETSEQREILMSLGCTVMQGFYFSPAISALEMDRLLEEDRNWD